MKRRLSAVLATVMLTGIVSGCNTNGGSSDVTKIEIWTGDASAKQVWTELVNDYNSGEGKEKGIEIKFKFTTDNTTETDVAAQNDKLPDVVTPTYSQIKQFVKQGNIVALEDVEGLAEYAANYKTAKIEDKNCFDGKLYGLMTNTMTAGLIYNKDLFKEKGIVDENGEAKPPKTLDEMVEVAKKLTDSEKGIYGYSFPLNTGTYHTMWAPAQNAFSKRMLNVDFDNITYDYEGYFTLLGYMMKMRDDGSLFPGAETLDNDSSRAYFAEGLVGMMAGMSWDVGVLTSQFVANCDWDVAPYPVLNESESNPTFQEPAGAFFITKNGAAKGEKMAEVYKWLTSSEVITRFYETGVKIPSNPEMVKEGATTENKQFESFMNLIDDDYAVYWTDPTISIEGENRDDVLKKVWAGTVTSEEALADLNKRATDAFKKAVDAGDVDIEHLKEVNKLK